MLSKKEISRLFKSVKEYKTEELVDILTALADYVAMFGQEYLDVLDGLYPIEK